MVGAKKRKRLEHYPSVAGEFETLTKLTEGCSLARFGDGELAVMEGFGYVRQRPDGQQVTEMRRIISDPRCLVGIPPLKGPKLHTWKHFEERFIPHLRSIRYYSALITRPDAAPWIRCNAFVKGIQGLWAGKNVAVVGSEPGRNKLHRAVEITTPATFIECPWENAYFHIDETEAQVRSLDPEIVLLSAGPTATCLADRLCDQMQAIDLGHIGGFLLSWLK